MQLSIVLARNNCYNKYTLRLEDNMTHGKPKRKRKQPIPCVSVHKTDKRKELEAKRKKIRKWEEW